MSKYSKSFDDLLAQILTDYKNLDSAPDVSQGSITFIKGACLASALWGLYKYQDWILKQVFPDTGDTDFLNHWGSIYGIARLAAETDADYAKRMIGLLQQPAAGGTAADYLRWSQEAALAPGIPANLPENFLPGAVNITANTITLDATTNYLGWVNSDPISFGSTGTLPSPLNVGTTYYSIFTDATRIQVSTSPGGTFIDITDQGTGLHQIAHASQGTTDPNQFYIETASIITPNSLPTSTQPGSVDIILVPNNEAILDSSNAYHAAVNALRQTVSLYIDDRRPVTANTNTIDMETLTKYNFIINAGPINVDIVKISADVQAYIDALLPGQILYESQITAICLYDGAQHAEVTSPVFTAGQIIPGSTEAIRVNTITVNPEA